MIRRYDSRIHKPQKEKLEGIEFDSAFEASVFRHIRMLYPIECIKCHEPIPVLPASVHFPPLVWRCDFQLTLPSSGNVLFIEAKGINTREFKLTLQALAHTKPEIFSHLLIVHSEIGVKIGRTLKTINVHLMYQLLQKLRSS